jgi:hypothetical protein
LAASCQSFFGARAINRQLLYLWLRNDWFMKSKLIYWIPVVGVVVSLMHYSKENGMKAIWAYYQAFVLVILIWIAAYLQSGAHGS